MQKIRFTLLALHSVLLSGFMVCVHSADGFSMVEPVIENYNNPWSTYANPANNDSRVGMQGMHLRHYGMPRMHRFPPPRLYKNHISFTPDSQGDAFTVAEDDSNGNAASVPGTVPAARPAGEDATSIPNGAPPGSEDSNSNSDEAPAASDGGSASPNGTRDESSLTSPNSAITTSEDANIAPEEAPKTP